jgi:tetratricopeptide (TPR) repeat protein
MDDGMSTRKTAKQSAAADAAQKSLHLQREARELVNQGARLIAAGQTLEAIPLLRRALELTPDDVSAAINLGGAYILSGKHRLAVPLLERACQLEPDNVMAWTNLGAAYLDRPPYSTVEGEERALRAFEQALEIDPLTPHVSYNLGIIRRDRQEWELALGHFQDALAADPGDEDARLWYEALKARIRKQADAGSPSQTNPSGAS